MKQLLPAINTCFTVDGEAQLCECPCPREGGGRRRSPDFLWSLPPCSFCIVPGPACINQEYLQGHLVAMTTQAGPGLVLGGQPPFQVWLRFGFRKMVDTSGTWCFWKVLFLLH